MEAAPGAPNPYRAFLLPLAESLNSGHKSLEAPSGQSLPVECRTLAEVIVLEAIAQADLLKMRMHGNDYKVLLSTPAEALRRFRPATARYPVQPARLKRLVRHFQVARFRLGVLRHRHRLGLTVFAAA